MFSAEPSPNGNNSVNTDGSGSRKVSSAIAGPKFATSMMKFREYVHSRVNSIKQGVSGAHGYIVFSDTKSERFFYFQDPPTNQGHAHSKNGPANAVVYPSTQGESIFTSVVFNVMLLLFIYFLLFLFVAPPLIVFFFSLYIFKL